MLIAAPWVMKTPPYKDREQTEVKHRALERYLQAFAPIVGTWAADIIYVDCLAGPWKSVAETLEDTSFSKAINVMRSAKESLNQQGKHPSFRALLIEHDLESFQRLDSFAKSISDIKTEAKRWDFSKSVSQIVSYIKEPSKTFPFIFIDPEGWELAAIDLITPLLQLEPGEVLINLMTSWITRFLVDPTKPFEKLVGDKVGDLRKLSGDDLEDELVRCYADNVRTSGRFRYVCTLPVMKSSQDAFHFYLIYGTRHIKGVEVFKEMEKSVTSFMHGTRAEAQSRRKLEKTQQYPLLGAEETYSERRFSRLHARNSQLLQEKLMKALAAKGAIPYDHIWGSCMQYPTILEGDLHDWINEWKRQGRINIRNASPNQRFPKRKANQIVEWIEST